MKDYYILLLAILVMSCQSKPEPIVFGEDHCDYCKMSIVDPRFGGEIITQKGRVYKFDAVECMVPYVNENKELDIQVTYALPFDAPGKLVPVDSLYFQQSPKFKSPMGGNIGALTKMDPEESASAYLNWNELQAKLSE